MNEDEQHLKLLSIFHYVAGGLAALAGCFPIIHFLVGLGVLFLGFSAGKGPPALIGLFFVVIAGGVMLFFWTLAACLFIAGRFLARREHYTFCLVVAGVSCTFMPPGTVLGVFTIIVLMRPTVKEMFGVATDTKEAG